MAYDLAVSSINKAVLKGARKEFTMSKEYWEDMKILLGIKDVNDTKKAIRKLITEISDLKKQLIEWRWSALERGKQLKFNAGQIDNLFAELAEAKSMLTKTITTYEKHLEESENQLIQAKDKLKRRNTQLTDLRGRINDLKFQVDHDKQIAKVDLRDVK